MDVCLAGLLRKAVRGETGESGSLERFLLTRLIVAPIGLACLPLLLVWRGLPGWVEILAALFLIGPVVATIVALRSRRLIWASLIASAGFTGVTVLAAICTGGLASPLAIWLASVPLEAALSRSRAAVLGASVVTLAGLFAIAAIEANGALPVIDPLAARITVAAYMVILIARFGAEVFGFLRQERQRRAALRSQEAQERSLLCAIDDLVTWHDGNGHVLNASPAAMKLLGIAPARLRGRGLFEHVHVQDRPAFLKAISDAAVSERPVRVEFRLLPGTADTGEDGTRLRRPDLGAPIVWAEMRAHRVEPAPKAGGSDYAVVAVTRDVSAHKQHAADLEAARARAERADESKGRFLATVTHELRTPLNAIIGFSELLASDHVAAPDPERRREYAGIIRDSGHHLLEVVNTLLDISKIETGNFTMEAESLDLGRLARGCCDLMQIKADQAGIQLDLKVAPDLPEITADPRACRQILINLLSNGLKFTPRGGRVSVQVQREHDRMVLTVTDTGVGIGAADLARVGDPFFQARADYARPYEGTGLGLSVVRGLLGLLRGTVSIESAPGQGTSVAVTIPLDTRAGSTQARPVAMRTAVRRPQHQQPILQSA